MKVIPIVVLILISSSAGAQVRWHDVTPPVDSAYYWNQTFFVSDRIVIAPQGDTLFRTTNGGANWNTIILPGCATCISHELSLSQNGIAFIQLRSPYPPSNTLTFRSADSGATWEPYLAPRSATALSLAEVHVAALRGEEDYVVRTIMTITNDSGAHWIDVDTLPIQQHLLSNDHMERMEQRGDRIAYTRVSSESSEFGHISTDFGKSWNDMGVVSLNFYPLSGINWLATGTDWAVYRSSDNGSNWQHVDQMFDLISYSFVDSIGYAIDWKKKDIVRSSDAGRSWSLLPGVLPMNSIHGVFATSANSLYADFGGRLYRGDITNSVNRQSETPIFRVLHAPSDDHITISTGSGTPAMVAIYDSHGVLIRSSLIDGSDAMAIDSRELPNGVYFLRCDGSSAKALVQH